MDFGDDDGPFSKPEDGSHDRYVTRRRGVPWATHTLWWIVHNAIAHPLIAVLPIEPAFTFQTGPRGRCMDADMAKNEPLKLADDEVDFWKEAFLTQLRYLVNRSPWAAAFTFSSPGDPAELADLCVRDLRRRR